MGFYTFSDYINAWSIKKALEKLNIELKTLNKKGKLLKSTSTIPKNSTLFFTEESSLIKYLSTDHNFDPKEMNPELIDNKYLFSHFLTEIGERPIPYEEISPKPNLEYPIIVKSKHSWSEDIKNNRGYIINSLDEYNKLVINKDNYFFQKLLSTKFEDNISISGYFNYKDNSKNLFITTAKARGETKTLPTGMIIKTIKHDPKLIKRSKFILKELKFIGPFELEFIKDNKVNEFYVNELNPRFWMQNYIFSQEYNNSLIRRYLNLEIEDNYFETVPFKKILWINNIKFLRYFYKYVHIVITYKIKGYKLVVAPTFKESIIYLLRR